MLHRRKARSEETAFSADFIAERERELNAAITHLCTLSQEEAVALRDVNLFHWICSMMRISGSLLSKAQIGAMLGGDTVTEATIEEYRYLRACTALYGEFRHMASLDVCLDEKYIIRIDTILCGNEFTEYRRGNPVLRQMGYNPPHSSEISKLMRAADREIASQEHRSDPLQGAVRTHDMIMAVWPFEEKNAETAYAAMSYELFYAGYPLPALDISDEQHLEMSGEFVKKGSSLQFTAAVVESLFDQCGGIQLGL